MDPGLVAACADDGHLEIVKLLVSKGANNIFHCFKHMCWIGHLEIIQFFVRIEPKCANELHKYFSWPHDSKQITGLLYLKVPLILFQQMQGFQELNSLVANTEQAITGANVLLHDLLNVVAQCVII